MDRIERWTVHMDHEEDRRDLWRKAYLAAVSFGKGYADCLYEADRALEWYDKKFPAPIGIEEE